MNQDASQSLREDASSCWRGGFAKLADISSSLGEANLIRSFLDQLPRDWQVAPGQYLADVQVGAFARITVEDTCTPPNTVTWVSSQGFIIGPFRLIREASGQLHLVVDEELQIQVLPPPGAARASCLL